MLISTAEWYQFSAKAVPCEDGKRFFLKKETKTFAQLLPWSPRQSYKSFLVLFCKKELLFLP